MTLTTAKFTLDEYHQIVRTGVFDDRQVELLNGEIVEMPPEGESHAATSSDSGDYLRAVLGDRAKIREGHPITIPTSNSEPEPDLAIVRPSPQGYRDHHPYPEDIFWLIEFSDSSLRKDLDPKAKVYAAAGIPEYWVVNLRATQLVVFRDPVNGEYQSQQTFTQGHILSLAFPAIALSVRRLLD
jgi:Uma2 family endonuclease